MEVSKYINLVYEMNETARETEADGLTQESYDENVLLVISKIIAEGTSASESMNDIKHFLKFV